MNGLKGFFVVVALTLVWLANACGVKEPNPGEVDAGGTSGEGGRNDGGASGPGGNGGGAAGGGGIGGEAGAIDCSRFAGENETADFGFVAVTIDFPESYGPMKFVVDGCELEPVQDSECVGNGDYVLRLPIGAHSLVMESEHWYRWRESVDVEAGSCGSLNISIEDTISFLVGFAFGPDMAVEFPVRVWIDGLAAGVIGRVFSEAEFDNLMEPPRTALVLASLSGMIWLHAFNGGPHSVGIDYLNAGEPSEGVVAPEGIVVEGAWILTIY